MSERKSRRPGWIAGLPRRPKLSEFKEYLAKNNIPEEIIYEWVRETSGREIINVGQGLLYAIQSMRNELAEFLTEYLANRAAEEAQQDAGPVDQASTPPEIENEPPNAPEGPSTAETEAEQRADAGITPAKDPIEALKAEVEAKVSAAVSDKSPDGQTVATTETDIVDSSGSSTNPEPEDLRQLGLAKIDDDVEDPFEILLGETGGSSLLAGAGFRLEPIGAANKDELAKVRRFAFEQLLVERPLRASPLPEQMLEWDWDVRTYKVSEQRHERLEQLGKDPRLGRLGKLKVLRVALRTIAFCIDNGLPVYRSGHEEALAAELAFGIPKFDHRNSPGATVALPSDVIESIQWAAEAVGANMSDVVALAIDQIVLFLEVAAKKAARKQSLDSQ